MALQVNYLTAKRLLFLALWSFFQTSQGTLNGSYEDFTKLKNDIFRSYNLETRPLLNQSATMKVRLGFDLWSIDSVDGVNQKIKIHGVLFGRWRDEILKWDPSGYSQIAGLPLKAKQIWKPELQLHKESGEMNLSDDSRMHAYVDNKGDVFWDTRGSISAHCIFDFSNFPKDSHHCSILLSVMHFTTSEVELLTFRGTPSLEDYRISEEWDLKDIKSSIVSLSKRSYGGFNTSNFRIDLKIQRVSKFYTYTLLIPIIIICTLSLLVFLIPVGSGEMLSYSVTLTLTFSVYINFISGQLPASARNYPEIMETVSHCYIFSLSVMFAVIGIIAICKMRLKHFRAFIELGICCGGKNDDPEMGRKTTLPMTVIGDREAETPMNGEERDGAEEEEAGDGNEDVENNPSTRQRNRGNKKYWCCLFSHPDHRKAFSKIMRTVCFLGFLVYYTYLLYKFNRYHY